jgi:hypothetical protein
MPERVCGPHTRIGNPSFPRHLNHFRVPALTHVHEAHCSSVTGCRSIFTKLLKSFMWRLGAAVGTSSSRNSFGVRDLYLIQPRTARRNAPMRQDPYTTLIAGFDPWRCRFRISTQHHACLDGPLYQTRYIRDGARSSRNERTNARLVHSSGPSARVGFCPWVHTAARVACAHGHGNISPSAVGVIGPMILSLHAH